MPTASPRRRDFRAGVLAAALTGTLLVASCSSGSRGNPAPEAAGKEGQAHAGEGAGTGPGGVRYLAAHRVPGLVPVNTVTHAPGLQIFASTPDVPGASLLTRELRKEADRLVAEARAAHPADVDLSPAVPELNIRYDVLVASGDLLGVQLSTYEFAGARASESSYGRWYDVGTGTTTGPAGLLAGPKAAARLADEVLSRASEADGLERAEVLQRLSGEAPGLGMVAFTPGGDVVVAFDELAVAAASAGRVTVTVPYERARSLLSPLGVRARTQTVTPGEPLRFEGGKASPVPSASGAVPAKAADCSRDKCIALTYDDGPSAATTPALLKNLARRNTKATFFMLGSQAAALPAIARRVAEGGHEIASHTYDHKDLTKLSGPAVRAQHQRTDAAIRRATGRSAPVLSRPPYGAYNSVSLRSTPYPVILWDVDTNDWKDRDADTVAARVVRRAKPGSVVLMHDLYRSTAAATPKIVDALTAKGYRFVTVSELFAGQPLKNGTVYSSRPAR